MPDVSVIIPTRNRWELLSSLSLPSARDQEDVDLEVLVVDDGSTDGTENRLREIGDPRLVVLRSDTSAGVAGARNRGIAAAKGEWLAFLDDDDLWSPRKLRRQLDVVLATQADFVYASAFVVDEEGRAVESHSAPEPATVRDQLLTWNVIPEGGSNVLARTALVRELGGFDERLFHLADWDMWIRLAAAGRAASVDEALLAYVVHAANLHSAQRDSASDFALLMSKHPLDRPAAPIARARWQAIGHRRAGRRFRAAREYLSNAVRYRNAGLFLRGVAVLLGERAMQLRHPTRSGGVTVPRWLERRLADRW
jgi:glycosyltransferase involved in cell wall biosynthesis